jgi:C4-dicarboxylate-binding protein DctP
VVPAFEVVDLPMAFKDASTFYAFEDGPVGQELLGMLDKKGIKGLGYVSNVPLDLFATQPIVTVEQFADHKIRAHSATLERTVKALGGNPITMPASEMFLALQQGVIDGAFTTVGYAAPNKYNEVAKYVTRVAVSAIAYPVVINLAFWNRLPADLKAAVSASVNEAVASNRRDIAASSERDVATLKAGGAQVTDLTPQQRAAWQAKLQPVYDDARKRLGAELVDHAVAAGR